MSAAVFQRIDRRSEVVDQGVAAQRNTASVRKFVKEVLLVIEAVGSEQVRRPVIEDHVAFHSVTYPVEVGAKSILGRAARGIQGRHAIGEAGRTVDAHANVIAGKDDVGAWVLTVELDVVVIATERVWHHSAEYVTLVRIIHPIAVSTNDGVVAAPADFNVAFEIASDRRIEGRIVIVQAIRIHVDEIARYAGRITLDDDRNWRDAADHVALRRG